MFQIFTTLRKGVQQRLLQKFHIWNKIIKLIQSLTYFHTSFIQILVQPKFLPKILKLILKFLHNTI